MGGDPLRRNQSLHCQYHQEWEHTTKDSRTLWNCLEQLVREGRLQKFLYRPNGQGDQSRSGAQGNASSRPPLGTINIIFAASRRTGSQPSRVMSVAWPLAKDVNPMLKRARVEVRLALSFSDEDKVRTIQSHDDTLIITLRIGGYDVKRVIVDQGSGAEVIYPDLYKGLNLKLENLIAYNSPLISFDGKVVILNGQIRLPIQAGSEVVEVNSIVVDAYSPYTSIVGRPWLHALWAVSSTLHLKVKYLVEDRIEELVGSQSNAR
ncbi:uncharacterized protein LOC115980331 [Quercus lobata]|uniref:uncharacterized protein LOC115980331 n=1 Tax=Quercus lobata TaxID=97700 RepID=UPI001247C2DC|nr:uncharacterized protein LOC115980331 [Quercus lobata]